MAIAPPVVITAPIVSVGGVAVAVKNIGATAAYAQELADTAFAWAAWIGDPTRREPGSFRDSRDFTTERIYTVLELLSQLGAFNTILQALGMAAFGREYSALEGEFVNMASQSPYGTFALATWSRNRIALLQADIVIMQGQRVILIDSLTAIFDQTLIYSSPATQPYIDAAVPMAQRAITELDLSIIAANQAISDLGPLASQISSRLVGTLSGIAESEGGAPLGTLLIFIQKLASIAIIGFFVWLTLPKILEVLFTGPSERAQVTQGNLVSLREQLELDRQAALAIGDTATAQKITGYIAVVDQAIQDLNEVREPKGILPSLLGEKAGQLLVIGGLFILGAALLIPRLMQPRQA